MDMIYCNIGEDNFKKYIPDEHVGQIMHQMVVLDFHFSLYVRAAECFVLYKVLVYSSSVQLEAALGIMKITGRTLLQWVHNGEEHGP